MTSFGILSVKGTMIDIQLGQLSTIDFDRIELLASEGNIVAESLLVSRLHVYVALGLISMPNVEGSASRRLDMSLGANSGPIKAKVIVHRLVSDIHDIIFRAGTGSIVFDVLQEDSDVNSVSLLSDLYISATSEIGRIDANIAVPQEQNVAITLSSSSGTLEAKVVNMNATLPSSFVVEWYPFMLILTVSPHLYSFASLSQSSPPPTLSRTNLLGK